VPECDVYEPDSTPGSALRGTSKAPAGEQEGDEAEERHIAQVFRIALKPGGKSKVCACAVKKVGGPEPS